MRSSDRGSRKHTPLASNVILTKGVARRDSFLTLRLPYSEADGTAFKKAFACYKSQFRSEEIESYSKELEEVWGGRIDLRLWFGAVSSDDIFTLKPQ